MIEGIKKNARSTFFPKGWTEDQVEMAIAEAYKNRSPDPAKTGLFKGNTSTGVTIALELDSRGNITTAYPLMLKEGK